MSDQTMQDVLTRLEAQEEELARLRTAHTRRSKLFGGRKRRTFSLGIVALLVALVPFSILAAVPFADQADIADVHKANVDTLYNLGITSGFPNPDDPNAPLYYPKNNVTREEMASFLSRTASLNRIAFTSRSTASATDDMGADAEKEYMTVKLTVPGQPGGAAGWVKVSFTGYVYARSADPITPNPTLLRGEIRVDNEAAGGPAIVTRSVVGSDPRAIVTVPASGTAPASSAERLDFSGSRVFKLVPGEHTFRMVVRKDVGTATDVGFGFGNMQAELVAFDGTGNRATP